MKSAEEIRAEHEEYQRSLTANKYKHILVGLEGELERDIRSQNPKGRVEFIIPSTELRPDGRGRINHRLFDYLISKGYRLSIGPPVYHNQTTIVYVYWD